MGGKLAYTQKNLPAYDGNQSIKIPDEKVEKIEFVTRPLQFEGLQRIFRGYGSQNVLTHRAAIITTTSNQKYIIHNTNERDSVIDVYKGEKYKNQEEVNLKDLKQKPTLGSIYETCKGQKKNYSFWRNNCIHAQERMKMLAKSKQQEIEEQKKWINQISGQWLHNI